MIWRVLALLVDKIVPTWYYHDMKVPAAEKTKKWWQISWLDQYMRYTTSSFMGNNLESSHIHILGAALFRLCHVLLQHGVCTYLLSALLFLPHWFFNILVVATDCDIDQIMHDSKNWAIPTCDHKEIDSKNHSPGK